MTLLARIPGLSQNDCLPQRGRLGGGIPKEADEIGKNEAVNESG